MAKETSSISSEQSKGFKKSWAAIVSAVSGAVLFFGIGFSTGTYKDSIECELKEVKLRQEFNEKFQNVYRECQTEVLNNYSRKVDELKTLIEAIKKTPDEKK